jgi:ElaB/YqjD/DUF883 family membrane-anchored ribosome-binding protein
MTMKETKNKVNELYNEGKNQAELLVQQFAEGTSNLYKEGKKQINHLDHSICQYTEEASNKIKEKPLTAMLIAGSIGFILSYLLKK